MPRKTLRERREQNPTDDNSNRLREIVDEINGLEKPADMMQRIKETLPSVSKTSARVGDIYTFVYNAKTPGMSYDPYPLVAVTGVYYWGFTGLNFHWGTVRNYTWFEVNSLLLEVKKNEIDYLRSLRYGKFRTK